MSDQRRRGSDLSGLPPHCYVLEGAAPHMDRGTLPLGRWDWFKPINLTGKRGWEVGGDKFPVKLTGSNPSGIIKNK